ncbi:alpha/beta hydrolase [Knoellia koreensis]|nr:alpha/beta hydrolase [Knoellia sp. DB2414S]
MRHSPLAMPVRMAALTALLDTVLRPPVERLTPAQLAKERGTAYPHRPPFTWVTGPVDRRVGITYGTAPARDGYEVPLRIYRPRSVRDADTDVPVIVFVHGGGYATGNVVLYDALCTHLAQQVRAVVVSVDYRLAPEHRAPTAAHDVIDAATWVALQSDLLRADSTRLALCGDSAGGALAAVTAQALRDAGDYPVRLQALIYPATDMTLSSPSIAELPDAPMLTRTSIETYRDLYCPDPGMWRDPLVSPLFGRLAGVAPALIQTADLDPLRDDGTRYAAVLRDAGVPVRLTNYLRVPHGFASIPGATPMGPQHRAELVGELRRHLYAADPPSSGDAS